MGKLNINGGGVDTNKKMADIDERFGPYSSTEAADAALGGQGRNTITAGLTVGILTANAGVKEYWYQPNKKTGQLELIPKGGNAADNPTEGNFASFDENGNVVDSDKKAGDFAPMEQAVPPGDTEDVGKILEKQENGFGWVNKPVDGTTPHIDQTTKHWMIGEEDTEIDAEGKSAYQVYVASLPDGETPMTEQEWLASLKGEKGDAGNNGHNPNLGSYADVNEAPTTDIQPGDYIVVLDTTATPVTGTIYKWNSTTNQWESTGRDANQAYFRSGEALIGVDIVKNLTKGGNGNVLSAEQGKILGLRTQNTNVFEEQLSYDQSDLESGYIVVPTGGVTEHATIKYWGASIPYVGFHRKLRFLGLTYQSTAGIGFAIYDANDTLISAVAFDHTGTNGTKEYLIDLPENAAKFKATINRGGDATNDFYCYVQVGVSLNEMPQKTVDADNGEVAAAVDVAILRIQVGDIKGELKKLNYTSTPDVWDVNMKQLIHYANGTTMSESSQFSCALINVENYRKVAFIGPEFPTTYNGNTGYAFFSSNEATSGNLVKQVAYDTTSQANVNAKLYVADVPDGATHLLITTSVYNSNNSRRLSNVTAYGYKGEILSDGINEAINNLLTELEPILQGLKPYEKYEVGKNLININDCLEGYSIVSGELTEITNGLMSNKLYLDDNTAYTVQGVEIYTATTNPQVIYGMFDVDDNYLGRIAMSRNSGYNFTPVRQYTNRWSGYGTFTYHNQGEAYIRIVIQYNEAFDLSEVQLELGSEKTQVEPYERTFEGYDIAKQTDLQTISNRVATLENNSSAGKLMKVTISDGSIIVRTSFSDSEDFILKMSEHMLYPSGGGRTADSLTFDSYYVCPKTVTDAQGMSSSYRVGTITDSVGAIIIDSYYAIYAQHGWTIPYMAKPSGSLLDSSDVGSTWLSNGNDEFILAKVDDYLYFVPVFTTNADGTTSASWDSKSKSYPTSFTHVQGAEHTANISGITSRYDLRVQKSTRKYIVDSVFVGNGVYYCDDFIFNEYVKGINPAEVSAVDWFSPTLDYDDIPSMVNWCRSYVFKGMTVAYNSSIEAASKFRLGAYYGCIPQLPTQNNTYHSFSFLPKVKKDNYSKPFASDDGILGISCNRDTTDLFDADDTPDRAVAFLNDGTTYKLGMAGGLSLVDGISEKTVRNAYINGTQNALICTYGYSSSTKNKLYPMSLMPGYFANGLVDTDFVKNFCCYYSWFNPNDNADGVYVYTYKVSDGYIVYVHTFQEFDKIALVLPSYAEGMRFDSIIEKTTGASLLTDVVSFNKLYASFEMFGNNRLDNYLVFKLI